MKYLIFLFFAFVVRATAADLAFTWDASPTATTDGLTGYVLQKEGPPAVWTDLATVPIITTTYLLKNVASGTHTFRVIGKLPEGFTSPTNSVNYTSNGPTNLRFVIQVTVP